MALCGSSGIQSLDETAIPNHWVFDLFPEDEATTRNFCGLKVNQMSLVSSLELEHSLLAQLFQLDLKGLRDVGTLFLRLVSRSSELS